MIGHGIGLATKFIQKIGNNLKFFLFKSGTITLGGL
jgi:hypothetical protein